MDLHAAELDRITAQVVRASTAAVVAMGLLVLAIDVLAPSPWLNASGHAHLRTVAAGCVGIALVTRRVDVRRALRTGSEWRVVALWPLAVALMVASLAPVYGQASVITLCIVLSLQVAGLISGGRVALGVVVVLVVHELWAFLIAGAPDVGRLVVGIGGGLMLWWMTKISYAAVVVALDRQAHALAEVERVATARQDFVATVSHELRTPVHVVAGFVETLDTRWDELDDPMRRDIAGRVHRNAVHLRGLVDGLLDFTRLRSDHVQLQTALFDVGPVVAAVVGRASSGHTTHEVRREGLSGGQVIADPMLVERVLDNLVRNACDHTPAGTTVTVEVQRRGDLLRFSVMDDGPGIDAEDLPRVTERFYRGGGDHLRRGTGGVGLGLAFCAEVLELHGRQLEIESDGAGSRFSFALPLAAPPGRSAGRSAGDDVAIVDPQGTVLERLGGAVERLAARIG